MNHVELLTRFCERINLEQSGHDQRLHGQGVGDRVGGRHTQDRVIVKDLFVGKWNDLNILEIKLFEV